MISKKLLNVGFLVSLFLGGMMVILSLFIDQYKDEALFHEKLNQIYDALYSPDGAFIGSISASNEAYEKLREEAVTYKYVLQDYGVSMLLISIFFYLFRKKGTSIVSPKEKLGIIGLSLLWPLVSTGSFLVDISLSSSRQEVPPWNDSPGVIFLELPFLLFPALIFTVFHLLTFLPRQYKQRNILKFPLKYFRNYWLYLLGLLCLLLSILSLLFGYSVYVPSYMMLLYFLLSLVKDKDA